MVWFIYLGTLLLQCMFYLTRAAETYVTCLNCPEEVSPSRCRHTRLCGKGEVCYTREFTNNLGVQRYSLGCEDQTRCNIFLNTKTPIIGKRDVPPASPNNCFDCCTGDQCNGQLCQGSPTTSPSPNTGCPTCTCPANACPEFFIPYKNSCYMFVTWHHNWTRARSYCKSRGADLVTINSQDEQDFLVNKLMLLGIESISFFYTSGAYSHSTQQWKWVDGSTVQYTNWLQGSPGTMTNTGDFNIVLTNPCFLKTYNTGPWARILTDDPEAFICEKQTVTFP